MCFIDVFVCMSCVIKNCTKSFNTEILDSENMVIFCGRKQRGSINIQLVRAGLVISVSQEHGTGMDHIVSAPATSRDLSRLYHCVNRAD